MVEGRADQSGHGAKADALAQAVFSASLSLLAILVAVIAVLWVQVTSLESRGLGAFADNPRLLLNLVVVFFVISAWSAFWSFMHLLSATSWTSLYKVPIILSILGLPSFVVYWVWFS